MTFLLLASRSSKNRQAQVVNLCLPIFVISERYRSGLDISYEIPNNLLRHASRVLSQEQ